MAEDKTKKLVQFLKKTYELVEDPNTNELISWNYNNQTFIIWDHVKFSRLLLPKYFTHDNFSSFVYQLNNYGFRKVNNIPCEYFHELFQPGRKYWLYDIKKRSQDPKKATLMSDLKRFQLIATECEKLKVGHEKLKIEINELKREQKSLEKQLVNANFEEGKEEDIVKLVLKALSNSTSVQEVIEHLIGNEIAESGEREIKKPRLSEDIENIQVSFEPNNPQGAVKTSEEGSQIEDLAMTLPNLSSGNCSPLEKMLFDDLYIEKDCEGDIAQGESIIMLQLKDLITKPSNSSCDNTGIEEKEDEYRRGCDSMMLLAIAAADVQKT